VLPTVSCWLQESCRGPSCSTCSWLLFRTVAVFWYRHECGWEFFCFLSHFFVSSFSRAISSSDSINWYYWRRHNSALHNAEFRPQQSLFAYGLVDTLILKGTESCCNKQQLPCLNDFDILFFYVLVAFLKKMEKINQGANKKWYSHQNQGVIVTKRSQSKEAKPKMRERKFKKMV
jgi:hypothetical protein